MITLFRQRLYSFLRLGAYLGLALGFGASSRAQTSTAQPVVVVDFNHDGIPDALVLSTSAPTATIALGSVPYGTFVAASKVVSFPAGCTSLPQGSVLAGDFNGDGLADLAFFCGRQAAGVMLGNGDGTFGKPTILSGIIASIAAVGDFNKDGKLDIVAVGSNGTDDAFPSIIFFAGNGNGTFAQGVTTGYATNAVYTAVTIADVNGDGYPDVVAANFTPDQPATIDIYGNNKDGTFGTAGQNASQPDTSVTIGASAATSILAGNFYGSGKIDFVVPGTGATPALFVLQNTSSVDAYSFADPVTITSPGLLSAAAGSFTGGMTTDLLVANGSTLSVLANDGTGNFASTYSTLTLPSTTSLFAVADANGDGLTDVYTASLTAGALQLGVNVVTGSATATAQPIQLGIGTKAISAAWAGNVNFNGSNATGQEIVTGTPLTIASFTPNTVPLGASATTITLTGAGFGTTSVVQVDGTAIPTTLVNATTLTAVVPASYFATAGTLQITVADPNASGVSPALTLTVLPPTVSATITAPPTTAPGSQTTVTVTLSQPYPIALVGTLTIGFTRATTPQLTDPSLQFADGGTTLSFPIPANSTTIPPIELQAGTIAGTITIPLTLTAGTMNVTPANLPPVTIVVPPAVPAVSGMTVARSGNQLTVVIHGFSNTREVVNAKFHFTAADGATIGTPDLTLPADTIFNTDWFDTNPSDAYGSTFTYTQVFNTSDGAANIGSVDATLTNTVGASTTTTAK